VVLLGVLAVAAVTTLLGPGPAQTMRSMVHWSYAPLGDAGMYLATSTKAALAGEETIPPETAQQIKARNTQLLRQLTTMQDELDRARRYFHSGRGIFSSLFGPQADAPVRLIPARIVAADALPYGQTRLVNAGSGQGTADGLYATTRTLLTDRSKRLPSNLAVLSGQALAGRLTETAAFTARLQLVTDTGFATRAQIRRIVDPAAPRQIQVGSRMVRLDRTANAPIEAYAEGNGTDGLIVKQVSRQHNILPGDILQTRPAAAELPVAVTIGTVTDVVDDVDHPGRVILTVRPAIDPATLREVFIVVPAMGTLGEGR